MFVRACVRGCGRTGRQVTAIRFDDGGMTMGVGTSNGYCVLFDIRSQRPVLQKAHQYGLPVIDVSFHSGSGEAMVISSDQKIIKIWKKLDVRCAIDCSRRRGRGCVGGARHATVAVLWGQGQIFTNIEGAAEVNDVCVVRDGGVDTGLLFAAGEQSRVMTHYIPALGRAPRWCVSAAVRAVRTRVATLPLQVLVPGLHH